MKRNVTEGKKLVPGRISIGIIGAGRVGSSVAMSVLQAGIANELLISDMRSEIAEGEAMDLDHGGAFYPTASVSTATIGEMMSADAIVVAAGRGGRPGESRLNLLRDNAEVTRGIGRLLYGYRGIVVMVANPVDVLTFVMAESSGISPERVIGTGTMLDTARLRQALGRELRLDPRSIHAQVVGEHGDSEVVLWSGARVGGAPLREWPDWNKSRECDIAREVRTAAYEIIRRKGATNHAIGLVTADLLRGVLRGERRILTVSRVHEGIPGLEGMALSLPAVVGADGAVKVFMPEMSAGEREAFDRSVDVLRGAVGSLSS